jgi:hypothetical protein
MTYPSLFAAGFCLAAGFSIGSYVGRALCLVARNTIREWRSKPADKPKVKRFLR